MNEFLQLTDFDTDEVIFIAPELIKSIRQLPKDKKYGRRTVLSDLEVTQNVYEKRVFLVKEEATEIALKMKLNFIQLTDSKSGEPVFIMPKVVKYIHQLKECEHYVRRTSINGYITVKEEATEIALKTGLGFIDNEEFLGENFDDFKTQIFNEFFATHRFGA